MHVNTGTQIMVDVTLDKYWQEMTLDKLVGDIAKF
jgi:hypothetical protein